MAWNPTIYMVSQQWASTLSTKHMLEHSGNKSYGENLAYLQGYGIDPAGLIKTSIDLWYNEVNAYDFSKPGFSGTTGHFTCLVWKSSTQFAIAVSVDPLTNEAYIVMNTAPPGNYLGQFKQNVLPSLSMPLPNPTPVVSLPNPTPVVPTHHHHHHPPTHNRDAASDAILNVDHKHTIFKLLYAIVAALNTNQPKPQIITIINTIVQLLNSYPAF